MRPVTGAALAAICLLALPVDSAAQTSLGAFGAVPMTQLSNLGDGGMPLDFGGRVGVEVAPGVQLTGEFGRLGGVMPDFLSGPAFTRLALTASAFYGEGGIRLMAAPRSPVTPYVEGSAGIAHLNFGIHGMNGMTDAAVRALLGLVDTRDPLVGAGGGVLLRGGPLQFDLGYRYKRILANSTLTSLLSVVQPMDAHQVRFGAGIRF